MTINIHFTPFIYCRGNLSTDLWTSITQIMLYLNNKGLSKVWNLWRSVVKMHSMDNFHEVKWDLVPIKCTFCLWPQLVFSFFFRKSILFSVWHWYFKGYKGSFKGTHLWRSQGFDSTRVKKPLLDWIISTYLRLKFVTGIFIR